MQVFKNFNVKLINSQDMNCKTIKKQILSYLDGELHGEMATNFDIHIKNCKNCQNEVERLKMVSRIIATEKMEYKVDPFMSARIMAKLNKREVSVPKHIVTLRYLTITSLAAAGVTIGIIIGSLFSTVSTSSESIANAQEWERLADEFMPEIDNNPYNMIATTTNTNETPTKP